MIEYIESIETTALGNTDFRRVLFTGQHAQLIVMCLLPGEETGNEMHPNVDQFFRIEQGQATFVFGEMVERTVHDGDAVLVPAGTSHNVINTSKTVELKLSTICSPPDHQAGTVHKTRAEAGVAEGVQDQ